MRLPDYSSNVRLHCYTELNFHVLAILNLSFVFLTNISYEVGYWHFRDYSMFFPFIAFVFFLSPKRDRLAQFQMSRHSWVPCYFFPTPAIICAAESTHTLKRHRYFRAPHSRRFTLPTHQPTHWRVAKHEEDTKQHHSHQHDFYNKIK